MFKYAFKNSEQNKYKYLGVKFRHEMSSLLDELMSCNCRFIRCVKSNERKVPFKLD